MTLYGMNRADIVGTLFSLVGTFSLFGLAIDPNYGLTGIVSALLGIVCLGLAAVYFLGKRQNIEY